MGSSYIKDNQCGVGLLEILVVLVLAGITSSIAISKIRELSNNPDSAAALLVAYTRDVRARAMQETLAYTIQPGTSKTLIAKYSVNCTSATKTTDPALGVKLPSTTSFASTTWSVCFDSRGFADQALTVQINGQGGRTQNVQIVLGGAARKI